MKNIEKELKQVWDFQETFGHPQTTTLFVGTLEKRELRNELFIEELQEFKKAVQENNNLEKLDAVIDMAYIILGSVNYHGLTNNFSEFLEGQEFYENTKIENYYLLINNFVELGNQIYISEYSKLSFSDILNFYLELITLVLSLYNKLEAEGIVKENVFKSAFLEVHCSNMSKADKNGKAIYSKAGKILKGPNYLKPELSKFLK